MRFLDTLGNELRPNGHVGDGRENLRSVCPASAPGGCSETHPGPSVNQGLGVVVKLSCWPVRQKLLKAMGPSPFGHGDHASFLPGRGIVGPSRQNSCRVTEVPLQKVVSRRENHADTASTLPSSTPRLHAWSCKWGRGVRRRSCFSS